MEIIKEHIVVFVVNRKDTAVIVSEHELHRTRFEGVQGETGNLCDRS